MSIDNLTFMGLLPQKRDVMIPKKCLKYNHDSHEGCLGQV